MRIRALSLVAALALVTAVAPAGLVAQSSTAKPPAAQKVDEEYTRLIEQHLQDPGSRTELVDHLPASDTVPTPLKFLGRMVGTPGELTYAKDIHRYYAALAAGVAARPVWTIGTSEEGRDIVALAICGRSDDRVARHVQGERSRR